MSKQTLIALGLGGLSASVSLAFITGWPGGVLLVYLAPLPLYLAGLGGGISAATIAGATGILTAGLLGGAMAAGIYGLLHALPAWLVVGQTLLKRNAAGGAAAWYPAGHVLCALATLGGALLLMAALASWGAGTTLASAIANGLERGIAAFMPELSQEHRREFVAFLSPMFAGGLGTSWMIMTVLNAAAAQGVLVRIGRNLRPSPRFAALALPGWYGWLLAAAAAAGLLGALLGHGEMTYIGRNLAMILAVPYFFLGLAVVHAAVRRISFPATALAFFYFVMIVSGWVALIVAGLGMCEDWAGLRKRFGRPDDDQESE